VVPATRIEAPRSKSPPTSSGTLAMRCTRFRKAASAYGSACWIVRPPLAVLVRNQAAHFHVADQPQESQILARARMGRRAGEGDEHQLRHFIAQRHPLHPAADRGGRFHRGRMANGSG